MSRPDPPTLDYRTPPVRPLVKLKMVLWGTFTTLLYLLLVGGPLVVFGLLGGSVLYEALTQPSPANWSQRVVAIAVSGGIALVCAIGLWKLAAGILRAWRRGLW